MKTYRPNPNQRSLTQNHFQNLRTTNKYTFQELTNLECSEIPVLEGEQYLPQDFMDDPNSLSVSDDLETSVQEPENCTITASPEENETN